MQTSPAGRKFIEGFEGLILHAYRDSGGVWTIGYGHTSAAGPPYVHQGMVIDAATADQILSADLHSVEIDVNRLVKRPINQNQFDALVSFHFNTGELQRSSVLRAVNYGDFAAVPGDLMLWDHVRIHGTLVVVEGLRRRRAAEGKLFMTPEPTYGHKEVAAPFSFARLDAELGKLPPRRNTGAKRRGKKRVRAAGRRLALHG
jgi:lysozyme